MNKLREALTQLDSVDSLSQLQTAQKEIKRDIETQKRRLKNLKVLSNITKFVTIAISFWVEKEGLKAYKLFWGYKRAARYSQAVSDALPEYTSTSQLHFSLWTEHLVGPLWTVCLKVEGREKPW